MPRLSSLPPKYELRSCVTRGMRVDPPTRTISSTSSFLSLESRNTCSTGLRVALKRSEQISSNLARVTVCRKSTPSHSASISTVVLVWEERALLAISHCFRSRCRPRLDARRLAPSPGFFLSKALIRWSMSRWSKSSPPKCVSPAVAFTWKIPPSIVRSDTSKVPPPRSKISTFLSSSLSWSRPKAMAAAVGSLMMRKTSKPAMEPASLVAWRWLSLKYAGTVMTALLMSSPTNDSAISFILISTMLDISSGVNSLLSSSKETLMCGFPPTPGTIVNGHCSLSFLTTSSSNLRPIKRFAS
mmetsp:Transcript_71125/g.160920  ORF Transcript_71125/g.160920 Transcript_71125/m.160920 type:complete len:300 (-) Transcript_71125:279-1178(-)